MQRLTRRSLLRCVRALADRDPDLAGIVSRIGPPPLWERPEGFPTLIHIILEQQVSLASARAAFTRLEAAARPLTPEAFLALDDDELKRIGFSRQKTRYGRNLADAIAAGRLRLEEFPRCPDDEVRARLVEIKGIGNWTADIYLLMAMGRADVWPTGDLALAVAAQRIKGLPARPTPIELGEIGEAWRPMRAVAARLLWHDYLSRAKPDKE